MMAHTIPDNSMLDLADSIACYMQKRFRESTHDEPNRAVTPSINIPVKLVEDADRIVQQICKAYCNPSMYHAHSDRSWMNDKL